MVEGLNIRNVGLPEMNAPIIMEGTGGGNINGYRFNLYARLHIDPVANVYTQTVVQDDVPELQNALLAESGTCVVTSTGGIFARATEGAVNLIDVMGMPYRAEVDYVHINDQGKQVGEARQTLDVVELGPNRYGVTPFVEAQYNGPTDLSWTPGYAIYLRQASPGLIEGIYGQTIFTESGRIHALVRRRYYYESGRTLPCDEVWHYKLLKMDASVADGLRRFEARVTTFITPAEGQHGDLSV